MTQPHDPFAPTGNEVDLSDYELPPTPGPFANEYPEGYFDPKYPAPSGIDTGDEGDE